MRPLHNKPATTPPAVWGVLLGVIGIIGIIDMPAMLWAGDPVIWRIEARGMLLGELAVDPRILPPNAEPGQLAVRNPRNGLWYSKYGLMNSLMLLPPTAVDRMLGGLSEPLTNPKLVLYNLWNVVLTVALAAVLMRLSGRYSQRLATRILFVAAMLYATFLWFYLRAQGSEIYQTLFFTAAFQFLVNFLDEIRQSSGEAVNTRQLHLAWLFVAAMVFTRILYLLLIPLTLLFVAVAILQAPRERRFGITRRLAPHLLVPPLAMVGLLGVINFVKFGSPFLTGYHQWRPEIHLPTGNWSEGLWGFFVMPRFSIFFYFPPLALALLQLRPFIRRYPLDALVAFGTGATFILLIAKIPTWAGEWTYGPRYVLFVLPVLSLPFILLVDRLVEARRSIAGWPVAVLGAVVLLYSAYLQFRVNQIDFHAYYYLREPLASNWNKTIESSFMDHHVGVVLDDIIRHRDDPMGMPWFVEMTRIWSPDSMDRYYRHMRFFTDSGNHYWWQRPKS